MPRKPAKTEIDRVLDKIDSDIAQLETLKARLITERAAVQEAAMTPAAPKRPRTRARTAAAAPAEKAGI